MFALADWMNMRDSEDFRKQKFEKECNPPPISESLKKIMNLLTKNGQANVESFLRVKI
jgi:hypothetical protein